MKIQPVYNNKLFKKGLEFAANNGALFVASTSLLLSTVARPIAILATPNTDKENKRYAASKSLASSAVGYLMMLTASLPLAKSIKKIDEKPKKYLSKETIKALQNGEKTLTKSSKYKFATQLFKLGLGFLIAVPKSIMTCALIPFVMKKFNKSEDLKVDNDVVYISKANKKLSPRSTLTFEGLEKPIGKLMNKPFIKTFADKFHKTNYEQHIISATDALATGAFIAQTSKSKKIKEERKSALMYNAAISTGLCITGGYAINDATKKSTNRFIRNFRAANKYSPKLDKYIEGIRVAKPALILGSLYYIAIPLISTFMADRVSRQGNSKEND